MELAFNIKILMRERICIVRWYCRNSAVTSRAKLWYWNRLLFYTVSVIRVSALREPVEKLSNGWYGGHRMSTVLLILLGLNRIPSWKRVAKKKTYVSMRFSEHGIRTWYSNMVFEQGICSTRNSSLVSLMDPVADRETNPFHHKHVLAYRHQQREICITSRQAHQN